MKRTGELFKSMGFKPPFVVSGKNRKTARAAASKSYWDDVEKRAFAPRNIAALRKFMRFERLR